MLFTRKHTWTWAGAFGWGMGMTIGATEFDTHGIGG
jgi:hypothetical protein